MKKRPEKYLSLLMAIVLAFGLVSPCISVSASAEDITSDVTAAAESAPVEEALVEEEEEQIPEEEANEPEATELVPEAEPVAVDETETPDEAEAIEAIAVDEEQEPAENDALENEEEVPSVDPVEYTLTLDANGGSVSVTTITVTTGSAIGELPTPTYSGYYFVGWKDASGNTVTASTVYELEADSTLTAKWVEQPANPAIANTTNQLFQFHCTTDETHEDQTYNFFGTYVKYKAGSMQYDEATGVFTATLTVNSISTLTSTGVNCPDKVWGHTHYCLDADGKKITSAEIEVKWDPTATGSNSTSTETTGLWLPNGPQTINVSCYSAPAAPTTAKIQSTGFKLLWIRSVEGKHTENIKISKLIAGTYEVGEMTKKSDGAFYIDITITDLAPYLAQFNAKYGTYVIDTEANEGISYTYSMKYTGKSSSVIDYAQDGSGWTADYTGWNTQDKNNGKQLWVTPGYTVTFEDGAEGKIFETTSQDVAANAATPTHETEYEGYTFNGWTPALAETVTEDVTYTASYTANTYIVSFDTNGGNYSIGNNLKATFGEVYGALIAAGDVDGYTSEGWYVRNEDGSLGDEEITAETLLTIAGDHVLVQKRSIAEPEATLVPEEEADWTLTYEAGKTFTMTADVVEYSTLGYSYQWYKDGESIDGATSKELTVDVTVANSGTYKVEVTAFQKSRATDVIPSNTSATTTVEQTLTVNPGENTLNLVYNPGLENGVFVMADCGESIEIALDESLNMTWEGHTATATWTTNEDGTGDSYTTGDTYTFEDENGGETVTLYLQWNTNEYTVTFEADGATVTTITKAYGEKLTAEDYPAVPTVEGYTGEWVEYTDEITGDVTIQAVYTKIADDSEEPDDSEDPDDSKDPDDNDNENGDGNTANPVDPTTPDNGDGNTNGNTDGNTNGDTNGNTDGNTNGNTNGDTNGNTDGNTNGNTDGNTDGNTNGNTNGTTNGNATTSNNTNTTNSTSETPKTGDSANLMLWIGLLAVSAVAVCVLFLNVAKKRNHKR